MQLTLESSERTSQVRLAVPTGWTCPDHTVTARTVLLPADHAASGSETAFVPNVTLSLDSANPAEDLIPTGACEVGRRRESWSDGRGEVAMRVDAVGDDTSIIQLAAAREQDGQVLAVVCSAAVVDWTAHAEAFDQFVAAAFEAQEASP